MRKSKFREFIDKNITKGTERRLTIENKGHPGEEWTLS